MGKFGLTLDMTGPVPIVNGKGVRANITKFGTGRFFVEFDQNFDMDEYIVGATATGAVPANPQAVEICASKSFNGSFFTTAIDDVLADFQLDIDFAIIPKTTQSCAMVDGGVTPIVRAIRGFHANIVRIAPGHVRLAFDVPLAPNEYAVTGAIRQKWLSGARYVIAAVKGLVGGAAFVDVMTWSNGVPADLDFDIFTERYR